MKINKSLIILSLLLIFYICLGAVSAVDNVDLSVNNMDVDVVENTVDLDDEIDTIYAGETGNFSSLNKTITESSDSIIYLDKNYTFDPNTDTGLEYGIIISKNNIMIDGQGYTIDGANIAKIFNFSGKNVTIKGINFINAHNDDITYGSAISFNKGSDGSFINCSFDNCYCEDESNVCNGGAIYFNEGTTGSFMNCSFDNCYCNSDWEGCCGGAIYFGGNGSVVNCSFDNCNCNWENDDVDGVGGAICFASNGSVVNCSFDNCNAIVSGGAIYFSKAYSIANVVNCSFVDCNVYDNSGGAICIIGSSKQVSSTVSGCYFMDCSAESGGAIFMWDGNGVVSNCSFVDCFSYYGSAISIVGSFIYIDNLNKVIPKSHDLRPPIYNDNGFILSDVEITTMKGKVKNVNYGETINITGTVTTNGLPIGGTQNLTFKINGKEINVEYDDYGIFSAEYTIDFVGEINVDATYKGSRGLETVKMGKIISKKLNVVVTVDDVKGKAGDKVNFTAKVKDTYGNLVDGGVVVFGFNGKEYKANVIKGIATVEVVLPKAGTYSATAYYEGDKYHNSAYGFFTVEVSDDPNPVPSPKKGIPMEHTGNPLLVLLFTLISLPLVYRRK